MVIYRITELPEKDETGLVLHNLYTFGQLTKKNLSYGDARKLVRESVSKDDTVIEAYSSSGREIEMDGADFIKQYDEIEARYADSP